MNINTFSDEIKKIINDKEFINVEFKFGSLNSKSNILNTNIYSDIFDRFYSHISSKYDENNKLQKIYYSNDLKLVSINDNTHICIRTLESDCFDIPINNHNGIRMIIQNNRIINNINFPSLINYDNVELNEIKYFVIKYKNSEITIEFCEFNDIKSINLKTKIDIYNINNFIHNFQFIISKFYMKKFKLDVNDNTYNSNKRTSKKKNRFSHKKKSFQNKHFKTKVNSYHNNSSN